MCFATPAARKDGSEVRPAIAYIINGVSREIGFVCDMRTKDAFCPGAYSVKRDLMLRTAHRTYGMEMPNLNILFLPNPMFYALPGYFAIVK